MARPRARGSAATPKASPVREPEVPWKEIDRTVEEFRVSAVRMVERVVDLMAPAHPSRATTANDIRLVRSIFGKWSMEVLVALHSAPSAGFEELRRSLPGITPRVLSVKLKGLEAHGLVRRELIDDRPPRVRYTLTDEGWTVAWLADPVLVYLEARRLRDGATEAAAALPPVAP